MKTLIKGLSFCFLFISCCGEYIEIELNENGNPKYYYCTEERETDLAGNEYIYLDDCYSKIETDIDGNETYYLKLNPDSRTDVRCLTSETIFLYNGFIYASLENACEYL